MGVNRDEEKPKKKNKEKEKGKLKKDKNPPKQEKETSLKSTVTWSTRTILKITEYKVPLDKNLHQHSHDWINRNSIQKILKMNDDLFRLIM